MANAPAQPPTAPAVRNEQQTGNLVTLLRGITARVRAVIEDVRQVPPAIEDVYIGVRNSARSIFSAWGRTDDERDPNGGGVLGGLLGGDGGIPVTVSTSPGITALVVLAGSFLVVSAFLRGRR